jgi:hypothetical protein
MAAPATPSSTCRSAGSAKLSRSLHGESLVAVSPDGIAGRWSLDGRALIAPVIGAPGSYPSGYNPDGSLLILESIGSGGPIQLGPRQLWDTRRVEIREELSGLGVMFIPDGRVAAGLEDGSTVFLDLRTRAPIALRTTADL